ncbi:MAG: sigma 54-interacting transcriptional regulator [Myxococcales bacterium]|nr:sigma 54-interacting transcriptional regulator [Myxococcales bacterium]
MKGEFPSDTRLPAARPCALILHDRHYELRALPVERPVTIGRAATADIQVRGQDVSPRHVQLRLDAAPSLEDLDSCTGTWVDGRALPPFVVTPICAGHPFRVGAATIVVLDDWPEVRVDAEPDDDAFAGVVVVDPVMRTIVDVLRRVAASDISVLLLGETGSGKEVLAGLVHRCSPRRDEALIKVNCAALSPSLIESELFGHERGAFTGAVDTKPGLIEVAHRGTLFLDEIGELPPELQAKLLRVLDEGCLRRVGGVAPVAIDVRFVAATNRDIRADVARHRFRADLYYRLAGTTLSVPPLRRRPGDVVPLAHALLTAFCRRLGRPAPQLSPAAIARLRDHAWLGNVRELRNVVERAATLHQGPLLDACDLEIDPGVAAPVPVPCAADDGSGPTDAGAHLRERERIVAALEFCHGNQSAAAKLLAMSRRTLLKRLDAYQLPRPRKGRRATEPPS